METHKTKKSLVLLSGILFFGIMVGCAEQQGTGPSAGGPPIQDVAPEWVFNKGAAFSGERQVFYGVGNAAGLQNASLRRRSAEAAARRDIQQTFQSYIAGLNKQYIAETTAGDMESASVEQHIEDVMKQVTSGTLVGVDIVKYWEHPTRNEAYALARLDLERFLETMQKYSSATSQFKELDEKVKEYVRNNAAKAHEELNKATDPK